MQLKPRKRKAHTKSRAGCIACKHQHTKCDEGRPRCGRCERLDIDCVLGPPPSSASSSRQTASGPPSQELASPTRPHVAEPLHLLDLELLHNYSFDTYATFLGKGLDHDVFRTKLVQLGFKHTYVLHALLAISALHMHYKDAARTFLPTTAAEHFDSALHLAQSTMGHVTEEDAIAMFFFSSTTAVYALAKDYSNPYSHLTSASDPVDDFVLYFNLTRGVHTIVRHHWPFLEHSWIGPLFKDQASVASPAGPASDYPRVLELQELLQACEGDLRETYAHALNRWLAYMAVLETTTEAEIHLLLVWPIEVDAEYLTLLSCRDPFALIILAHYAVLISLRPNAWWAAGWPVKILDAIIRSLDPEWYRFVEWPRAKIHHHDLSLFGDQVPSIDVEMVN
ncbi:hypothetical protein D6C86_01870 [Aureobasidium pullulans]|uniref:Zn(2)-C6 fungal-type domain-containing protein n=1 Tax=Aureobasidium pullulans TaxID=5580 RepID=A0A4S9UVF5_AURPU|nr:hypothetical protein D6C94_00888 [Aureobasidium pullulans]THZ42963.1 hypothetical protein D6C87_04640 [Aureobasidium pullulans]THZ59256.1 hypothetical protein D6C88_08940 [Aureobasidium pullulans]THZ65421.1 hypothetical protein D6C86_01870 [Aureobasidium pullulans]